MEKHWAIPDDVSPGNFPANVRISVCNGLQWRPSHLQKSNSGQEF